VAEENDKSGRKENGEFTYSESSKRKKRKKLPDLHLHYSRVVGPRRKKKRGSKRVE
jgi:hypothetical protein